MYVERYDRLFLFSIFLFSINVVIASFIECMPVESPSFPPNLVCVRACVRACVRVCVRVCGGWGGGASECLCMYVSECVCLLYPSIFIFSSSFCFG